ncbi:MAG: hypothetical protein A2Z34_11885 [Planctomycetes bacterium RBG_16_59_8]|nr:MAG: hypothetical protein A2Z34_11885 [Planctomycetes bacterium RBG_16_59_8]
MTNSLTRQLYQRFFWGGVVACLILVIGTAGYRHIGGERASIVDCLYMTFITVVTIGYGEVIDMTGNPGARIFTMLIALAGIGVFTYILSNFTALIVEGEINEAFRRRKMEKRIKSMGDHYIVCGVAGIGANIADELHATGRPFVAVDISGEKTGKFLELLPEAHTIVGDATDNGTLDRAMISTAKGIFAVTSNDNVNLVICLTARQLSPRLRIIAHCMEVRNIEKMKSAGADSVISSTAIGGLRMASEMIRPAVVSFLDTMLRDKEKNLRIEEIVVPDSFTGKPISAMNIGRYPHILLLAVKSKNGWQYNPSRESALHGGDTMVFMTTPEERFVLESVFSTGA